MRNEELIADFMKMSYADQQLFLQKLRRGREVPTINNGLPAHKRKRKNSQSAEALVSTLTPDQIQMLLAAIGAM